MDNNKIILKILSRRQRQKRIQEERQFDSSSVGDLAFLLLIFFIVTSSFILRQGIFFSLPSKNASSVRMEAKQILEVYPKNNGFIYNKDLLDRYRFKEAVIEHKKKYPNSVLIIYMDTDVKYDRLVDTLSIAKETGTSRVSLKKI
ncbi:MAG: biopolymer transporter ExbD [Spirochaetota bacterium]|nr:biopolymer transporter ExbD [Spirochaetota bacterium]